MQTKSPRKKPELRNTDAASPSISTIEGASSKVQALVDWLQLDIRRRGLRHGDRYMTSQEAARMLEVSTGTAHQAMRLLVEQNILDRRQKQGTYVGSAVNPSALPKRPRVYVLTPHETAQDSAFARFSEAFYPGVAEALGGAALQLEYMPSGGAINFVRSLCEEAEAAGDLGGFLLFRGNYEIQAFFEEHRNRFPAVVVGGVHPGIISLPWIDANHFQAGEFVSEYALRAGHRRMAVLMYEYWAPGDSRLMNGIAQTLETSSQRLDRFEICSLPPYERAISHKLRELLSTKDRPTIILARMALQVSVVFKIATELGLKIPNDVEVVFANLSKQLPSDMLVPRIEADIDSNVVGASAGKMLATLRKGTLPEPREMVYPVRLVERIV